MRSVISNLFCSHDIADVLYAMGGYEMNSVETFDLHDTEAWREIQPMTLERYGSAVVLMNRKIYALGMSRLRPTIRLDWAGAVTV